MKKLDVNAVQQLLDQRQANFGVFFPMYLILWSLEPFAQVDADKRNLFKQPAWGSIQLFLKPESKWF